MSALLKRRRVAAVQSGARHDEHRGTTVRRSPRRTPVNSATDQHGFYTDKVWGAYASRVLVSAPSPK
jgi:hypothetical protein